MKQKKYRGIERKLAIWGFGFNVPSLIFFAIFSFAPIIYAIYMSLYDKRVLSLKTPPFVGLKNYIDIFTNKGIGFINSLKSSAIFSFGAFFPLVIFSLIFSVLLYNNFKPSTQRKFEIMWYTPAVLSSVVATTIWMLIFDPRGLGNQVLNLIMNTPGVDHKWTTNPSMLRFCTIMVYFWKYIGYYIVLFITGLGTIPGTVYEAARIDGASRFQCFTRITLPLLKPTISLVSVLCLIHCLKTFSTQYMFYQSGAPLKPINVISLSIYTTGITNQRIGRACAMSIILFAAMIILSIAQLKLINTDDVDY
ncbi:MAG: sugar ABC transporter permease [Spirochaetales bacterium]|nr:sugar ABC transporter permease [Spirochaetales bacterium]